MSHLGRVPGIPQERACEVIRLAEEVSNAGIFLLMAMVYFDDKSDEIRVLSCAALAKRRSITAPLADVGLSLEAVLRELESRGLIESSRGFRKVRCNDRGSLVKHGFDALRRHLKVYGEYPTNGERVEHVGKLRAAMGKVCQGETCDGLGSLPGNS